MSTRYWNTAISPSARRRIQRDGEAGSAAATRVLRHIVEHGVPPEAVNPKRDEMLRGRIDENLLDEATRVAQDAGARLSDVFNYVALHVELTDPDNQG